MNFNNEVCFAKVSTVLSAEALFCFFSWKLSNWMSHMLLKFKHLNARIIKTSVLIWCDWSWDFLSIIFQRLMPKHRLRYSYWLSSDFILKCVLLCLVHRSFCSKRCFCRPYWCSVGSGLQCSSPAFAVLFSRRHYTFVESYRNCSSSQYL